MGWRTITRVAVLGWMASGTLAGCGEPTGKVDPCPSGICAGGDGLSVEASDLAGADLNAGDDLAGTGGVLVPDLAGVQPDFLPAPIVDMAGQPPPSCISSWDCSGRPWALGGVGTNGYVARVACVDTNACATPTSPPPTAAPLPALDLNYFTCNVQPVINAGCAMLGCHGDATTPRPFLQYAKGRLRHAQTVSEPASAIPGCNPPTWPASYALDTQCTSTTSCGCGSAPKTAFEWQANFDVARYFTIDPTTASVPAVLAPDATDLIAQPVVGGKSHMGFKMWAPGSPEYSALMSWIAGATTGAPCLTNF